MLKNLQQSELSEKLPFNITITVFSHNAAVLIGLKLNQEITSQVNCVNSAVFGWGGWGYWGVLFSMSTLCFFFISIKKTCKA